MSTSTTPTDVQSSMTPFSFERDWIAYYQAVKDRPPRDTLLHALNQFDAENFSMGFAVDLGCGEGRDTVELLRRGWKVLGIDGEAEAIARLMQRPDLDRTRLETRIDRFEILSLPNNIDLINASFCLPFCSTAAFPRLWQTITHALRPGGRFCGQLIGERDSWAVQGTANYQTRSEIETLLQCFTVEWLEEEEHPGKTALGEDKHWHIFHIVAHKL
jgi:tellurite methyltransferase